MGGTSRKFSLRLKLIVFTTALALITYSTSAFFLYVLYDQWFASWNKSVFTMIVLLLGIFWSGVLAYLAAGWITRPLQRLEEAAAKATEGHIDEDVPLPSSHDEIRSLAVAFNRMLGHLRAVVANVEESAARTTEKTAEMRQASETASSRARDIAATIDDISKGAASSAEAIQEAAAAAEDVLAIAVQVKETAERAEQSVYGMAETLKASRDITDSLISGIDQLADDQERSRAAVKQLEAHANQIGNITLLVADIAEQTNLLALNASIEAAPASTAGGLPLSPRKCASWRMRAPRRSRKSRNWSATFKMKSPVWWRKWTSRWLLPTLRRRKGSARMRPLRPWRPQLMK